MAAGIHVGVNVSGDVAFMRKLEKLGSTLFEFKEAFEETGEGLKNYFGGQAFESQGGVFGTPWASLSPSTVAYKSRHFSTYASVPLMRTGTMKNGFTYDAGATHLEVTNSAPYFKYHQSTKPRHKIPRRPLMGINRDVKEIIRHAFEKAMLKKMAGL